jgi:hypothetical protein
MMKFARFIRIVFTFQIAAISIFIASCGGGSSDGTAPVSVDNARRHSLSSSSISGSLFYGVNGHNGYGSVYRSTPQSTQLAQLQDLGMKAYRNEVFSASSAAYIGALANTMAAGGVTVFPVLLMDVGFGSTYNFPDEQSAYNAGYTLGQQTGAQHFPYYEVSNELGAQCLTGNVDGVRITDYDNRKFQTARGVIRGMIAGIRSMDSSGKIIMGADTWMHYAFDQMLANGTQPDGSGGHPIVTWDITAWHWFSDQGDITNACGGTGCYNVIGALHAFGQPVWITELGVRPSFGDATQGGAYLANDMLAGMVSIASQYDIESVQIYELYDDPPGGEGPYGLLLNDGLTPKPAYADVKQYIASHPR